MMFVNPDFTELLQLFNENRVRYLVIGGYALIQYTEPRPTKDLDVWIGTDSKNAAALYKSLKSFGAPLTGLSESDFSKEGYFYQIGVPPVRVDMQMGIPGRDFEKAWMNRNTVDFDGLPVNFISKQDLIDIKKASGRPEDLSDVDLI